MGTTLDNGIYLPDEGERNCYDGLAGNWVALDNHLGSTDIHVTINDKQAWDGHVADTVKHVTAEDKAKWDAVTSKADDSDVVHVTGDETVAGNKNFQGLLTTTPSESLWPTGLNTTDDITYLGREVIHLEYKSSGQLTDLSGGAWDVAALGAGCFFFRINNGKDIRYKNLATGDVNRIPVVSGTNRFINDVTPNQDNTYGLGSSSLRWRTINGLNPGSLGMPDLNNGIDISGYITVVANANKESFYTPPSNGWISVSLSRTSGSFAVLLIQGGMASSGRDTTRESGVKTADAMLPVVGGVQVSINSALADSVVSAYFYPCQGNI